MDMLFFTCTFDPLNLKRLTSLKTRDWFSSDDGKTTLSFHDDNIAGLPVALAAYAFEVSQGWRPETLILTAHRCGDFSFNSDWEIDLGLKQLSMLEGRKIISGRS